MKFVDFYCYTDGNQSKPIVKIQVPDACPDCGEKVQYNHHFKADGTAYIATTILSSLSGACCRIYFSSYRSIWDTWKDSASSNAKVTQHPNGVVCSKCNSRNPWGEPNRSNGTYVCYECK